MANGTRTRARRTKARTLFLSDIHLGFRHARVRELNEFLAASTPSASCWSVTSSTR